MKIALVYNPRLAPRRMVRVQALAKVLEGRGHLVTHHFGDEFVLARDAPDSDCLVMAGGDGTARLIIGRQPNPGELPNIAIYPLGTINLLARELGYPRDPEEFAKRIEAGGAGQRVRIATLNDAPFLACA